MVVTAALTTTPPSIPGQQAPDLSLIGKEQIIGIDYIVPSMHNPRLPEEADPDEDARLRAAMQEYGFIDALVGFARADGKVDLMGGHRRLEIARELGLQNIPFKILDDTGKDEREKRRAILDHNDANVPIKLLGRANFTKQWKVDYNLKNAEVARDLKITQATVKFHLDLMELPREIRPLITHKQLRQTGIKAVIKEMNERKPNLSKPDLDAYLIGLANQIVAGTIDLKAVSDTDTAEEPVGQQGPVQLEPPALVPIAPPERDLWDAGNLALPRLDIPPGESRPDVLRPELNGRPREAGSAHPYNTGPSEEEPWEPRGADESTIELTHTHRIDSSITASISFDKDADPDDILAALQSLDTQIRNRFGLRS